MCIVASEYTYETRVVAIAATDTAESIECQIRTNLLFPAHAPVLEAPIQTLAGNGSIQVRVHSGFTWLSTLSSVTNGIVSQKVRSG